MPAQKVRRAPKRTTTSATVRPHTTRTARPPMALDGMPAGARSPGAGHRVEIALLEDALPPGTAEELDAQEATATILGEPGATATFALTATAAMTATAALTATPTATLTTTSTGAPPGTAGDGPVGAAFDRPGGVGDATFAEEAAPLDQILALRTASWFPLADEPGPSTSQRRPDADTDAELVVIAPLQPDEFVCAACFLMKRRELLVDPAHGLCRDCAA